MKSKLINTALLLISISVALIVSELALRHMLFSESNVFDSLRNPSAYAIYPRDKNENFHNEDYWKLHHLWGGGISVEEPHPVLGLWGSFFRETLKHVDQGNLNGRRPVILFGDSFAKCVDTVKCFEDYLNNDEEFSAGHYFLNYGVGGYGVDQISLLFEMTYKEFEDPFIVFSMLTTDLDRSMLAFRDAQKPLYKLDKGRLVLEGVPITLSTSEYVEQNPPAIRSYLFNRFRNSVLNPFKSKPGAHEAYIQRVKSLNGAILDRVIGELNDSGLDYIVVIFHPVHHTLPDWRLDFLLEVCEENDVPYICERDIRLADTAFETYEAYRYAIAGDGHPSSYMNRLMSNVIKSTILGDDYRSYILEKEPEPVPGSREERINFHRDRILRTPEWLESVKAKAEKRGIPLDSMILLDAIYLVELEGGKH